jgi:carbamoyltransferase
VCIPTCCDDSGIALGAALAAADPADRPSSQTPRLWAEVAYAGPPLNTGGLGPAGSAERAGRAWRTMDSDTEFIEHVADLLAQQRCVAWLEGGLETGPRALGHRSLLVSAHWRGAREYVSRRIKGREWFRPTAPICPAEIAGDYFAGPLSHTDTMLFGVRVRPEYADRLMEVRHIDGTARLQVLHPQVQPLLHRLCHAVAARTGLPILINTSANRGGRPILNELDEALYLLRMTELDAVAVAEERMIVR